MKKSASWAPAPNLKVLAVEWNETDWVVSVTGQDHVTCQSVALDRVHGIVRIDKLSKIFRRRGRRSRFAPGGSR